VTFDCDPWRDERAQVNETTPRSVGGDPHDPSRCELICRACHFTKRGEHAPTKARMDKLNELAAKAKRLKAEART
jgi:hypothetical protein